MRPVAQQTLSTAENPRAGDCFQACVASILELEVADVPAFCQLYPEGGAWWAPFKAWLGERGLDASLYETAEYQPPGWSIVSGPSPRFPDVLHCCVAVDGEVAYDPHPDDTGLPNGVTDYIVIHGAADRGWTRYNGPASWTPETENTCTHPAFYQCCHPGCDAFDCTACEARVVDPGEQCEVKTMGHYCPLHRALWYYPHENGQRYLAAVEAHNAIARSFK